MKLLYLYQVVALDMNLIAILVCIEFISRETTTLLFQLLSFFRRSTNNRELVGIVTDESLAVAAAVTKVYPNAHHILYRVHPIVNVIKRISVLLLNIYLSTVTVEGTIRRYTTIFSSDVHSNC